MSETRRNFLVGLFMVMGLGALGYLLVLFGEAPSWLGGAEWTLRIRLNDISGIEEGAPIYLNGIKVGRVTDLDFYDMTAPDRGIEVIGRIKNEFSVPKGSVAQCVGAALGFGQGRIDIFARGESEPLAEGGMIEGANINPLDKILPATLVKSVEETVVKIGSFADTLTPVANDLHALLQANPLPQTPEEAKAFTGNIYSAVQRLDSVLAALDDIVGDSEIHGGLVETVKNVRTMSEDGTKTFANLRDSSTTLKADLERITASLQELIAHADSEVTRLSSAAMPILDNGARITSDVRILSNGLVEGKGTVGLLLTDERMYEEFLLTIERAREMVDSLRRLAYRFEQSGKVGLSVNGIPVEKDLGPK